MNNLIFKTNLLKGAKGSKGDTGVSFEVPTGGIIAYDGNTIPEGYAETDPPPQVQAAIVTYQSAVLNNISNAFIGNIYVKSKTL